MNNSKFLAAKETARCTLDVFCRLKKTGAEVFDTNFKYRKAKHAKLYIRFKEQKHVSEGTMALLKENIHLRQLDSYLFEVVGYTLPNESVI